MSSKDHLVMLKDNPVMRPFKTMGYKEVFYYEGLSDVSPASMLDHHTMSPVQDCIVSMTKCLEAVSFI
jgi:hypothetical protein